MDGSRAFSKDSCRLGEFALETWQGFVFVNLDPHPRALRESVAGLDDVLGDVDLSTWVIARTLDWGELPVSWKLVIENGAECYHHLGAHRTTLEPVYPHASVDVRLSDDDHWIGGYMQISREFSTGDGPDGFPLHPLFFAEPGAGMSAVQRASTLVAGVFPMFFFAMSPDFVTWFRWLPTGPESHRVDLHIVVPPTAAAQPDRERVLDEIEAVLRAIQDEDVATTSAVQRSLRSRFAGRGPLSPLEYPLWRFQRYLASRLLGNPGTPGE
jgi:phenylpropionate dioxygenase-like ring-hydroxylating dioxygenase large terminal subunit